MSLLEHIPYTDERVARQLRIEELIVSFKPDPHEAAEIIMAVLKQFKDDEEIKVYSHALYKSLDRHEARNSDPNEVDECDEARDWLARRAGL